MKFRQTDTPAVAAAKASFSTATGYRLEKDPRLPSHEEASSRARRRPDPLADIFDAEVVPMLTAAPGLRVGRHLRGDAAASPRARGRHSPHAGAPDPLLARHPRRRAGGHLPADSTSPAGPDCPTSPTWAISASRSRRRRSITGSITSGSPIRASSMPMSCSAARASSRLAEGMQNALWALGGTPREHRTDSLSAAFRNLDSQAQDDLTRRYDALCAHYRMMPTRNNAGIAHENGAIEGPHGHLKRAIADALLMRASSDFHDLAAYRGFIDEIVGRRNARNAKRIESAAKAKERSPMRNGLTT